MKVISSKEYALHVQDEVENAIEDGLYGVYTDLAKRYGFDALDGSDFYDELSFRCLATMRDAAIELFEECGMDVRSDGRDY